MTYYLVRLLYLPMNKSFLHLAPSKSLNHGECKSSVHLSVDPVNVLQRLSP